MLLDVTKLSDIIAASDKKRVLSRMEYNQRWLRFHVDKRSIWRITQPLTEFLAMAESLLPKDKYTMFKRLFGLPVKTTEVTQIIFDKLSRIFDGKNPVYNYQFISGNESDDWEAYRQDALNEPSVWSDKAWKFFKTEINSVLVVDLPEVQISDRPEPYFYFLTTENIVDYNADPSTGQMDYIIFRQPGDTLAVFDEQYYRVFDFKDGVIGAMLKESEHGLGYCPARFFWDVPVSIHEPDIKEHPLTKVLDSLNWYLFQNTNEKHLDLYASYPIYSGYKQECDYYDSETGERCHDGFLEDASGNYERLTDGTLKPCPKCAAKKLSGPGSYVEIPVPTKIGDNTTPDMRNPIQMLGADIDSLNYNVSELDRLKNEIITDCVGTDEEVINTEAVNDKQVQANFESQSAVLNRIKKGFEDAQAFVDSTVCRLRYGDAFISAKINYGTEFYTASADDIRQRYKDAKAAGASTAELEALQNKIIEVEYRNNPTLQQRMKVLADLEPYRQLTQSEVAGLYSQGIINYEDMMLKLNFSALVSRFERENTNILNFGSLLPYASKIERITKILKEYASESKRSDTGSTTGTGDQG